MNKIKTLIIGVLAIGVSLGLSAQDIHFSQFYMSPLNLNPAMTGVTNCDQRAIVNYRNQWAGVVGANAYNTYSASYDRKLAVGQEDYFGVGGTLWGDVAGESRFGTRQARVSFAYSKKMGGRRKVSHFLSVGADAGITNRAVSEADLRWPSQVTNGVFDNTVGNPEAIPNSSFIYPDLSAGLLWFSTFGDRKSLYGGVAMHHMNQPNVSFLGRDENLYSKLTIHGGGEYPINPKVSIKPDFVYLQQGPHTQINAGTSVRFKMGASGPRNVNSTEMGQFFQVGAWYRVGNKVDGGIHSDALIVVSRFDFDRYGIGFSYDLNISKLNQAASGNGSFELSLNYLICGSSSRGVYCPVF
ncbi:MAG: type IX secretion system PorP/SprF family membrane protein [Saprospiraceae bacterium]|jgi:type IX secretion system PorP/SprF family membrane protein